MAELYVLGYPIESTIRWHLVLTPATFFGALVVYLAAHKLRIIEIGGSHWPGRPWLRAIKHR